LEYNTKIEKISIPNIGASKPEHILPLVKALANNEKLPLKYLDLAKNNLEVRFAIHLT
jgi:hypothetical protein